MQRYYFHNCMSNMTITISLMAILCLLQNVYGSEIIFKSTPDNVKTGLTTTLALNCSISDASTSASIIGKRDVTQTSDNIGSVSSLVIMKDGQDVASVTPFLAAHVMDGSANVQVSGSLTGSSVQRGYLNLTITDPSLSQTGEFVCEANTVSMSGHIVTFSSSIEVGTSMPTMADLVAYVHDVNKKNQALESKVTVFMEHEKALEKTNEDLKNTVQALEKSVSQLQNRSNTMVFFNANLHYGAHCQVNQVVIFDHVIDNLGNGYNSVNGIFTCKVPGFYDFSVGCLAQHDKNFRLELFHNSTKVFSIYASSGTKSYQAAANSGTVQLAKDDVVKVVAYYESWLNSEHCSFSGHLIAPA